MVSLKKRGKFEIRRVPVLPALLDDIARVRGFGHLGAAEFCNPLWPWGTDPCLAARQIRHGGCGIANLAASPKGLRHAFGVHAVLSRVPTTPVQKWLGHEDVATTAIYTHVLGPMESEIAARMW
jgi:integrase/recombinase XerD